MDTIAFKLEQHVSDDYGTVARIAIYVNGRNLLDVIREVETPYAAAEGHSEIAGGYNWLMMAALTRPDDHFHGRPERHYSDGTKISLAECTCDCAGCWPLRVRVVANDDVVTWSDFEQPHRSERSKASHWRYDGFGPFVFDRKQYDVALAKLSPD
jgi:hypothetical protein